MTENPYASPNEPDDDHTEETSSRHRSFRLTIDERPGAGGTPGNAFALAIAQQIAMLLVSGLILDTGTTLNAVTASIIIFWCLAAGIFVRRRGAMTNADLLFIKVGVWPLIPIVALAMAVVTRLS